MRKDVVIPAVVANDSPLTENADVGRANHAWYALRRTLPTQSFERNLAELIECLPRYRVDELIVKVDTEEFSHGQPPLEWVKAYQPSLVRVRDAMSKLGIAYSLNPWITLGHIDRGRDAREALPGLRTISGHDGVESRSCACPLCEVWRCHAEKVWTLYAQTRPHVLWIEDDIRTFNHLPVQFGCFCDAHLQRFSQRVSQRVSRQQLVDAILRPGEPHPWRGEFLTMQAEVMNDTVAFLARIVHRVAPQTSLGLMSSGPRLHALEGRQWGRFANALGNGQRVYSRAPMGNYSEESPRGFYYAHDSIKLTRHCMPARAIEQAEVENVPFTRYSKSVSATFVQIAIALAYGCDGVTLNLFDHGGTPMECEPHFGRMLETRKPFLSALAVAVQQAPGEYRGVQLLFDERASRVKHLRAGAAYGSLAADGEVAMTMLESHGIATTYSTSSVAVLVGQQPRSFSDDQLRRLLDAGRGLLLDGAAADILVERGLGDLIGASRIAPPGSIDELGPVAFGAEELIHADFGGAPGRYLTLTLPDLSRRPDISRIDASASAIIVSRMVDADARRHHVCSYAYENPGGGRAFVLAFDLASAFGPAFCHPFRAAQLQAAIRWLGHGRAMLLVRGDGAYPLGFRRDAGRETLLGLFNLSLDCWNGVEFELADDRTVEKIEKLVRNGKWLDADDARATLVTTGVTRVTCGDTVPFDAPLFVRVTWRGAA